MSVELARTGRSEAWFMSVCRSQLRKNGLGSWADSVNSELASMNGERNTQKTELFSEICDQRAGNIQYYLNPTPAGREAGLTGYNFIYEWTQENEKSGHGYFYCAEF